MNSRQLTVGFFDGGKWGWWGGGKGTEEFSDKKWDREQQQKPTEANDVKSPTESLHKGIDQKEALSAHKNLFQRNVFQDRPEKID